MDEKITKVCRKCQVEKGLHLFRKQAASPDGRQYSCIDCMDEWARARYEANKEAIRQQTESYNLNNKAKRAEIQARYYRKHGKVARNNARRAKRAEEKQKEITPDTNLSV